MILLSLRRAWWAFSPFTFSMNFMKDEKRLRDTTENDKQRLRKQLNFLNERPSELGTYA
jgi:hypothetical protein